MSEETQVAEPATNGEKAEKPPEKVLAFTVKERFALLTLLPATGDWTTLKILRRVREEVSVSEDGEAEEIDLEIVDGNWKWNKEKAEAVGPKVINIPKRIRKLIVDKLHELNRAKQLHLDHMPLVEIFAPDIVTEDEE